MHNVETIKTVALAFSAPRVNAMVQKIRKSFERRDTFETSNGLSINESNSYTKAKASMLKAEQAVARFFLALDVEPSNVIERKVVESSMFNAKALDKVTELAHYACGNRSKLQRVTRAFIACAMIATDKGIEVITNDVNRRFLCSAGFTSLINDQDLIDHLDSLRHRAMTSGAETQSSQARNVLDVLGLGEIRTTTRARDSIKLEADSLFFAQFRADYLI